MHIVFRKLTEEGFQYREFDIKGIKYCRDMVAIDIIDIGWRTLTKEQYDSFEVRLVD